MKNLRTHGKSTIVWILLGLMILGLGGFGVTSFSGGSTSIGSVGETRVTADEYARALRSQLMSYQQQTGEPLNMAQAQSIGLPRAVQAQLFTAAALEEQARLIGVSVGDDQVRQTILNADGFKGPNGKFDRTAYSEALRRERMSESDFENEVRHDEARMMLHRAVTGGIVAPKPMVDRTVGWLLESRNLSWSELTEDQLTAPIADPDDATLQSWHKANAERFTAPEIRKISYVWLTPEMLSDKVQLDEAALREAYDARIDEFQRPERRLVSRLVFPSEEEAKAAKARIDAGEQPFEAVVLQRGLSPEDVDLGEVSKEQLAAAGDAVFALEGPGIVGPIQTDLGPALFSMHAILDPVNVSFEDAQAELRGEAALDRATRLIEDRSADVEDLLAGGSTLEQVADETDMELGQIEWTAGTAPGAASIAGYQAFRDHAETVTEADFPELMQLDDGGVFALRLDETVAPTLKPFDEVRDEVLADWRRAETQRLLMDLAEDKKLSASAAGEAPTEPRQLEGAGGVVQNPGTVAQPEAPALTEANAPVVWTPALELTRDGWIDGLPADVIAQGFTIKEPGEIEVVNADNRVFLIRLDAIAPADQQGEDARRVIDAVSSRISQSLQADIFDYYARAAQLKGGLKVDQQAIDAINAQVQ